MIKSHRIPTNFPGTLEAAPAIKLFDCKDTPFTIFLPTVHSKKGERKMITPLILSLSLLVLLSSSSSLTLASASVCPSYDSIRQPIVSANLWNNTKWAASGPFYVQATNEPSIPNSTIVSCPCNVYENAIPGPLGENSYVSKYTAACGDSLLGFQHNLTVNLAGFWNDTNQPAFHYENYMHAKKFGPTMIYDAQLDKEGERYDWVAVYACEGPPVQRKEGFSLQLLSTKREVEREEIDWWVERAEKLGLNTKRLEMADWSKCPSWTI